MAAAIGACRVSPITACGTCGKSFREEAGPGPCWQPARQRATRARELRCTFELLLGDVGPVPTKTVGKHLCNFPAETYSTPSEAASVAGSWYRITLEVLLRFFVRQHVDPF